MGKGNTVLQIYSNNGDVLRVCRCAALDALCGSHGTRLSSPAVITVTSPMPLQQIRVINTADKIDNLQLSLNTLTGYLVD